MHQPAVKAAPRTDRLKSAAGVPAAQNPGGSAGPLGPCSPIHGYWSVMRIPLADRLNRNPPVCECSLITTPFSFLR
jgi:hypothetical protein